MIHITEKIIGQQFKWELDPNTDWTVIGYALTNEGMFLVVGATWDQPNNRSRINTFKFKDVKLVGLVST